MPRDYDVRRDTSQAPAKLGRRRFFRTVAGPGGTRYPTPADAPTVYYCEQLRDVRFEAVAGETPLEVETFSPSRFEHVYQLVPGHYVPLGGVLLGERHGGEWFAVDGLKFRTTRKLDSSGSPPGVLWSRHIAAGNPAQPVVDTGDLGAIALRAGNVYVALSERVRRRDADGASAWYQPHFGQEVNSNAIAVDSAGRVYLAGNAEEVRQLSAAGLPDWSLFSGVNAAAVAVRSDDAVVTFGERSFLDSDAVLRKFDAAGVEDIAAPWPIEVSASSLFPAPGVLRLDAADSMFVGYIVSGGVKFEKWSPGGGRFWDLGRADRGINAVAIDSAGDSYWSLRREDHSQEIRKLDASGSQATTGWLSGGTATSFDAAADTLTSAGHGLANGDTIYFLSLSGPPAPLERLTVYYVVGATANTFQLSATSGGPAIDIEPGPPNAPGDWHRSLTVPGDGTFVACPSLDVGPDDQLYAAVGNELRRYASDGTLEWSFDHGGKVLAVRVDPDGFPYLIGAGVSI
ncbi:MAG: hypothetical protein KY476_00620 [Planctomycetes bacterium]|nr:hypothetical protein [Planctomycetota bacterium]